MREIINAILSVEENYQEKMQKFNEALEHFYELLNSLPMKNQAKVILKLEALKNELKVIASYPKLYKKNIVAVGGGFSAGKSCFINSFLKDCEILLPININPTTAIANYVVSDDEFKITGISKLADKVGAVDLHSADKKVLEKFTHNYKQNFKLKNILPFMIISHPFARAEFKHLCFIDTPGYNPSNKKDDLSTSKNFLSNASAVIWLSALDSASGVLTNDDLNFLREILQENDKKLYLVINKADLRSDENLKEILEHTKEILEAHDIAYYGISVFSSKKAEEKFFDKLSLFDFLEQQAQSQNTKTYQNILKTIKDLTALCIDELDRQVEENFQNFDSLSSLKKSAGKLLILLKSKSNPSWVTWTTPYIQEKEESILKNFKTDMKKLDKPMQEFKDKSPLEPLDKLEQAAKMLISSLDDIFEYKKTGGGDKELKENEKTRNKKNEEIK